MIKPIFHVCLLQYIPKLCGGNATEIEDGKHLTISDLIVYSNILNSTLIIGEQNYEYDEDEGKHRIRKTDYKIEWQKNDGYVHEFYEMKEIADILGIAVPNVCRSVKKLKECGIIKGHNLWIPSEYFDNGQYFELLPKYYKCDKGLSPDFRLIFSWYYYKACCFHKSDTAKTEFFFMKGSTIYKELPINARTRQRAIGWLKDREICRTAWNDEHKGVEIYFKKLLDGLHDDKYPF